MADRFVGILPAGGHGSRLAGFRFAKELLPVAYETVDGDSPGLHPKAVCEYAVDCFVAAGVDRCFVIVAPWKHEVIRYFSDGSRFGIAIAFIHQEVAAGLPPAVDLAYPWVKDEHVMFAMPDTVPRPTSCLAQLRDVYVRGESDLTLGVFPTDEAARLGPVVFEGERVVRVYDKCPNPPAFNTWGVAVWGPRFTQMLHACRTTSERNVSEESIGIYFDLAVQRGLRVTAKYFPQGEFFDLGTPQGLERFVALQPRHLSQRTTAP